MPGEIDRTSSQRYVSITANVEGGDLGRGLADRAGHRCRGPAPVRVQTAGQVLPTPSRAPATLRRPGCRGGGCDSDTFDRVLRVAAAGPGLGVERARRPVRRGDHAAPHRHDPQHRVVHGIDHVHRRIGVELRNAALHRRVNGRERKVAPEAARCCSGPAPADSMTFRHDGRHVSDARWPWSTAKRWSALGRAVIGGSTFARCSVVPSVFALLWARRRQLRPSHPG